MRTAVSFKWIVLIGLPIIMWQCYWYVGFNQEYTKIINFVSSFVLLAYVGVNVLKEKSHGYERYVKLILVLFLISLLMSFLYWGQSPSLTYRAGVSVLSVLYFFILKKYDVTEQELIKIVSVFAGI